MWHHFLTIPWVLAAIGLLGGAIVWLKHKAIATVVSGRTKYAQRTFWGWVREQLDKAAPVLASAPPVSTKEKTYHGRFLDCHQYLDFPGESPREWCLRLEHNGVTTKIPIGKTRLLTGVPTGALIEVDTQFIPDSGLEQVRRVRVLPRAQSANQRN